MQHVRRTVPRAFGRALRRRSTWAPEGLASALRTALRDGNRTLTLLAIEYELPGLQAALRARLAVEDDSEWRRTITASLLR